MKLIKAHVINFGKLHDYDIDFTDGVNSFMQENGWGKTTLSVFIKAMFYGMDHTTKKNIEENELKKYAPWQGGVYGGSLTFSYKEKEYCVSRTFSLKKNEDTVEIRDLKTNKVIENPENNLGVFLFGVNRDTYERSVHVTLDESPAGSPDISAKLNNLVEAADVTSFDEASKALDTKATSLKAKRGNGGEISELQNKIDFDRTKLTEIASKISQNEDFEKKISGVEKEISVFKEKQDFLGEQLSISAKYESKIRYDQLKEDVKSAENTQPYSLTSKTTLQLRQKKISTKPCRNILAETFHQKSRLNSASKLMMNIKTSVAWKVRKNLLKMNSRTIKHLNRNLKAKIFPAKK